jgi:hypothetical protein
MEKADRCSFYHLGSALGARDSRDRVSWLSAHLLDFPAHEAYRKELRKRQTELKKELLYDPSSTHSLVRQWGPSTRNILRSMKYAARRLDDPIKNEAKTAAIYICNNASAIVLESGEEQMPQSEGCSVLFLRRTQMPSSCMAFIPTPHLLAIFEEQRKNKSTQESLELFSKLSLHSLTRTTAGWLHERLMHESLAMGGAGLSIFQGVLPLTAPPPLPITRHMRPSTARLLPGNLAGLKEAGPSNSFYWIPTVANFPGVDGVLGDTDGNVYTVQATIAEDHNSPIDGIKKVWRHFPQEVRAQRIWHYVVVTASERDADEYFTKFSNELRDFTLGRARAHVQVWACVLRR